MYAFLQYSVDSLIAATRSAFEVFVFSISPSLAGLSPSAAEQYTYCAPATCTMSCPNERTSGVGLYEYNASGICSADLMMKLIVEDHTSLDAATGPDGACAARGPATTNREMQRILFINRSGL